MALARSQTRPAATNRAPIVFPPRASLPLRRREFEREVKVPRRLARSRAASAAWHLPLAGYRNIQRWQGRLMELDAFRDPWPAGARAPAANNTGEGS
jgi:hypothetical protein